MSRFSTGRLAVTIQLLAILLGSMLNIAGCRPPTQQNVAQQYAALVKKVADRLDQVQSREDADRAAAEIQKLLAESDAIVVEARKTDAKEKVADETQQAVRQQLDRITASAKRLQAASLVTDSLAEAMQQLGASSETIAETAAAGKLPPPQSPLEEAWIGVIQADEEYADLLASITTAAAAEQAIPAIVNLRRKQLAALTKVAELGGEAPQAGVPEKFKKHYAAAQSRLAEKDPAVMALLGAEAAERLATQLADSVQNDPALAQDPFRLSSAIRTAASKATVTLRNNTSLAGERHQQMVARLKELAGASEAQAVIEQDGTYRLVLAPVADFARLIQGIDFGDVSERNDQARSFTLTIDPARFGSR